MWLRNVTFLVICILGAAGSYAILFAFPTQVDSAARSHGLLPKVASDEDSTVQQLNEAFRRSWAEKGFSPAPDADALIIARRIALSLNGRIPSLKEIRELRIRGAIDSESWYLDKNLSDRRFADYWAERFARVYVGTEGGPFLLFRRRRFRSWLSDQLHERVPYDQITRSIITAEGTWTDRPAVNFLTVTLDADNDDQPDVAKLAGRVSRAFLGIRLDCVQCHDDNLGGAWRQSDFHQLAAFFSEARNTVFRGIQDKEQEYRFTYLGNEADEQVDPMLPMGEPALATEGRRRQQLADWVTHQDNRAFSRVTVNRVWALMFGKPLVEPIDDIPLNGPYPPGLEILASDFAVHGFNLRRLVRIIARSEVFRRASRADFEITPQHEEAWAVFPLTRLRAEQVAGSLIQSARVSTIDHSSHILVRLIRAIEQNDFIERFGDIGEDEFDASSGTVPQRLLMMNGELVKERTKDDIVFNAATRVARLASSDRQAIETAYLTVLTRLPTAEELEHFETRFADHEDNDRVRLLEDLWWSLLNSTEFSWNH